MIKFFRRKFCDLGIFKNLFMRAKSWRKWVERTIFTLSTQADSFLRHELVGTLALPAIFDAAN